MKKMILLCLCLLVALSNAAWAEGVNSLEVRVSAVNSRVSVQPIEAGKLMVSVTDANENAIQGLGIDDFSIVENGKSTRVTAVEPMTTNKDVPLNIVMVVDNSSSMRHRNAVNSLLDALEAIYGILRPIDNIAAVVFEDKASTTVNGQKLHARQIESSSAADLKQTLTRVMTRGLTDGTYLNDAIMVGLDVARQWPKESNKLLVVFSDGEDLNSTIDGAAVRKAAKSIENLNAYTIDYMPSDTLDPFMQTLAADSGGRAWKARSAEQLVPIFKQFSSMLLHRYVVNYRTLKAPAGEVAISPGEVKIEEVTTIDSAPLLNYVFFETSESQLSEKYIQLSSAAATDGFNEADLKTVPEKYANLLNIVGKRLRNHPDATVTLVGCNANVGEERGRKDLSRSRAEAVRAYLRYVWGIDAGRMAIEARNLPEMPSTNRIPEGQAENRRVEIQSDHPAILDTVKSEYVENVMDLDSITVTPQITAEAGVANWQLVLKTGETVIAAIDGTGEMAPEYVIPLESRYVDQMAAAGEIHVSCQVTDTNAGSLTMDDAARVPVKLIKRQQQQAMRKGYKVREKYALILFDFDSSAIKSRNKTIVDRIVARMQAVSDARLEITGHTDNIGKEAYNQKLSERRAEAVRSQIAEIEAVSADNRLVAAGNGSSDPLYDNGTPEGRSLNRTVTIVLEYEKS